MKKLILWAVLVAAGARRCVVLQHAAPKPRCRPRFFSASVSRGPITETVQASGTLESWRRVNVASQVSGVDQGALRRFQLGRQRRATCWRRSNRRCSRSRSRCRKRIVARQKNDIASQEVQLADLRHQVERAASTLRQRACRTTSSRWMSRRAHVQDARGPDLAIPEVTTGSGRGQFGGGPAQPELTRRFIPPLTAW